MLETESTSKDAMGVGLHALQHVRQLCNNATVISEAVMLCSSGHTECSAAMGRQ